MTISINSNFDGGNIEVIDASDSHNIRLRIRKDHQSDFYQWFYFRLTGAKGTECHITIENAGGAAYAEGWDNYRIATSVDRQTWTRSDSAYDGTRLTFSVTPETNSLYLAYFAPYSMERHADLVARADASPLADVTCLGQTLDGQDLDLISFADNGGNRDNRPSIWIIARQHPGETMAEWCVEGVLDRLLDPSDPVASALRGAANLYIVPNMNPDGSRRGHLRTNAAGVNLNRVWDAPAMKREPEVALVQAKMIETGLDICLDIHGDEALPYVFTAGYEGIPDLKDDHKQAMDDFNALLDGLTPDFQTTHGYPIDERGRANLSMATNWIAHHFQAMALTLEMPFKDHDDRPEPNEEWNPGRSKALGGVLVDALYQFQDQ